MIKLAKSSLSSPALVRANQDKLTSEAFKREFGLRVIEAIVDRTQSGKDKNGSRFAAYSKAYKESLQFQLYGKDNGVNLTLSGEMLSNMGVVKTTTTTVSINFLSSGQGEKAHGHINGTRSKKGKKQLPQRDFFGLPEEQQAKIMKDLLKEFNTGEPTIRGDRTVSQTQDQGDQVTIEVDDGA